MGRITTRNSSVVVTGERIKLSTHINELVRFRLHELTEMKEGVTRVIGQHGYWVDGGSLAEYLRSTSPGTDAESEIPFVEYKRIHWI